ncbi:MAG: PAS domain-containing protein [Deltaproteobacteria bacterium]|nr:PAS domain-containing protein [Deltaproteobacteria bacterium]
MADQSETEAASLHAIIADNEAWLIDRIILYAKRQGYTRYTSTLREAWRQSIAGLSAPILTVLEKGMPDVELGPDENFTADPLAGFGITEANRHFERGVNPGMFLGLMKYYRQSYLDLIDEHSPDPASRRRFALTLNRFFDRIEIGLMTAWIAPDKNDSIADLQRANRRITNEKNKYLTIFESFQSPVAVFDRNRRIDTMNHAWSTLFGGAAVPGADYYDDTRINAPVEWLSTEIDRFVASGKAEETIEKLVQTALGSRHLSIKIKRKLDVSEEFSGCVVILDDVTEQRQAESALQETTRNSERLQGALELAGAVCHDLNQPLMAITGYAELVLMDCPEDAPYRDKLKKIVEHVAKVGAITKKLMHVTRYETKPYLDQQIIDIEKASGVS